MTDNQGQLIERAKKNDIQAFEILIQNIEKKLFNTALRLLNNYYDAADITQEALVKAYKSINTFKGESSFYTWVYRILVNTSLDELKKKKFQKNISIDESVATLESNVPEFSPDSALEKKELQRLLLNALDNIPPDQKTAVILKDIQGFSYEEIAKIVNCPKGTVRSRLNRARLALREILQDKLELFNKKNRQ